MLYIMIYTTVHVTVYCACTVVYILYIYMYIYRKRSSTEFFFRRGVYREKMLSLFPLMDPIWKTKKIDAAIDYGNGQS